MKKIPILLLSFIVIVSAQAPLTWQWTGRVHPELKWNTIQTENFNVHYHQGIEDIAKQGASIAEQVRPTLLKQMDLDSLPRIDIIFTTEDEIMNGFAMWTNTTFIWVDQNDAAVWAEDEKWLFTVIAHELQHIVYFNTVKTWMLEPWGLIISDIPGWVVEGLAEYMTERWRPFRADLSHKYHVLKNKMDKMDPHHDGYSKLKYWADRFGDSTIVKTLHHRNKLKLFRFKKAFKKVTGITVNQFNEDWRRHMNTYYYGYRSQKETIQEIGTTVSLPIKKMIGFGNLNHLAFSFSSDSMNLAIAGKKDKDQYDYSLFIAKRDTAKEREAREKKPGKFSFLKNLFVLKQDTSETDLTKKKKKSGRVNWDLKEMDYGFFHTGMSWSPDGKKLAYAKYHFGENQSMIWGIKVLNTETKKAKWLTPNSMRAAQPDWSLDGKQIVFVAHENSTSNLYVLSPEGGKPVSITFYHDSVDIQLLTPRWSPDGNEIAFVKSGPDGNTDLYVMNMNTGDEERITENPEVDYLPVWHPDGQSITYTSHKGKGTTPNLYTVNLETMEHIQNTDVGDAVWSVQWTPKDTTVLAATLSDVDTVRIVHVDPKRKAETEPFVMRNMYTRWRTKQPEYELKRADPSLPVKIVKQDKYRFLQHPKHFVSLVLPYPDGSGMFGMTSWVDALGRNIIQLGGGIPWSDDSHPFFADPQFFFNYINAQHGPLWGINFYYNSLWNFRLYDKSRLIERINMLQFFTGIPMNFGNSMSSNHSLQSTVTYKERTIKDIPYGDWDTDYDRFYYEVREGKLPDPEEGKELIISLNYNWLNRRPHAKNVMLPKQGYGVFAGVDYASKSLFGDFTYTRLGTDAFVNLKIVGPGVLFGRLKTQTMFGEPPAQDSLALTRDPAIYLGFLVAQESHNPRGWDEVRLGDRLVFGTMEYRIPFIPEFPINILGFTFGSTSLALFSDFAKAWVSGEALQDWVTTAGYEIKIALQAEKSPILFFSIGQAQEISNWRDEIVPDDWYMRFALINPF